MISLQHISHLYPQIHRPFCKRKCNFLTTMYSLFESYSYIYVIITEHIASKAWYIMQHALKGLEHTGCHINTFLRPGQGRSTNDLLLLSNGKLLPGYEFLVTNYIRYMFCHVNNTFLVSQPYLHSNYKEIPSIYWMTLVQSKSIILYFKQLNIYSNFKQYNTQ